MIDRIIQWIRFGTVAWLMLIAMGIYGLYTVKYRVLDLQREIEVTRKELRQEQENLHVVAAEWAYLTRPDRLQELAAKNTALMPVQGVQVMEINTLPFPVAGNQGGGMAENAGMMPVSANQSASVASTPED